MPTLFLPYQRDPIAGGMPTPNNWYEFFRTVKQTLNESGLDPGVIADILVRLTELEEDTGSFLLQGLASVSVFGTPEGGLVRLELNNDEVAPGNTYYYGTDPTGVKGWFTVESALAVDADELTKTVGGDGVTTFGLASVADSGAGALLAITRDGFGRVAGTKAATITAGSGIAVADGDAVAGLPTVSHADTSSVSDLTSNNSNGVVLQDCTITFDTFGHVLTATVGTVDLDARYLQATSIGNGLKIVSNVLSAGESGTEDSTTFLRGDGVWSNALTGDFTVDTSTLKVDSANNRVGIGTVTPQRPAHVVGPSGAVATFPTGVGAAVPLVLENNGNCTFALVPSTTGQAGIAVYKDGSATVNGFFRYDVAGSSWLMDVEGSTKLAVTANGFQLNSSSTSFGGGVGVVGITNATTVPTSDPTGGGILYAEGGAGKWRGSSGTISTFGPAEPHCARCGSDFCREWENLERFGYLAFCNKCFVSGVMSFAERKGHWQHYSIPVFIAVMTARLIERSLLRRIFRIRTAEA